ncbi:MAG TPA: RNA polymerase sigma factor [Methylomirabilota bacterium]|nr:RNA polymerase sigma factor [Methylomirabilota bacterium]
MIDQAGPGPEGVGARVAETFRLEYARVVASVLRIVRDIDTAQEVVQEAFEQALDHWPRNGVPDRPGAWLLTTARRRALDHLRRVRRAGARADALAHAARGALHPAPDVAEPEEIPDDRLRLIFTCCHPALPADSRVALTLRLVGGLSTTEIARAFLVPEPTIAQRLVRAKRTIREGGFPYEVPEGVELSSRLSAVLAVTYLIFNEGYAAHSGTDLVRHDLCEEAIRLGHVLAELMPGEPEAQGLLALLVLLHSRRAARVTADGSLVRLAEQDRRLWDRDLIAEGQAIVRACVQRGRPGPYQLQAAINAVHSVAPGFDRTDWPAIATLYDQLYALTPTPVVALNRAVALAEVRGPAAGLAAVNELGSPALDSYYLFHASRADLLRRLGRDAEAAAAYDAARALTANPVEQTFLDAQRAAIG